MVSHALTEWLQDMMLREERAIALRELSNDLLDVLMGTNEMLLPVFFCACCPNKCYYTKGINAKAVAFVLKVMKSMDQEELDTMQAKRRLNRRTKKFDRWEVSVKTKKCLQWKLCDVANAMACPCNMMRCPVPAVCIIKKEYSTKNPSARRPHLYNLRQRQRQQ